MAIKRIEIKQRVTKVVITAIERKTEIRVRQNHVKVVLVGTQGPRGLQGEKGDRGDAGTTFVYQQSSPSTEWIVNHNLGFKPSVEVLDTGGNVVDVAVLHISVNQLRVISNVSFAGQVRLV